MARDALPRRAGALARLLALLAQFADHATRPFADGQPPNWYIFGSFVLLLICLLSVLLNLLLLGLFLIASFG